MVRTTMTIAMALLLGIPAAVLADQDLAAEVEALKATVRAQGQEIQQLRAASGETWLNERRAEEVKTLIRDVLSDADMRASLLQEGMTAGYDGEHFFIGDPSGNFLMTVSGLIQVRYIYTWRNGNRSPGDIDSPYDDTQVRAFDHGETGFELPRAKIQFAGHVYSPRIAYALRLAVDPDTNDVWADKITVGYELIADTLWISGGEDKAPFLREELTEPHNLLAVDRSIVNETFTAGRVQGVWATWHPNDMVHISAAISDGFRSAERKVPVKDPTHGPPNDLAFPSKRFDQDDSDFAITARADVRLAGGWNQMDDFTAWSGDPMAVFVGAAVHWEVRETGDDIWGMNNLYGHTYDIFAWTIDGSVEWEGANLYAAVVGANLDPEGSLSADPGFSPDPFGILVQGGYQVIPDKAEVFGRWEYLDLDTPQSTGHLGMEKEDTITVLTFGANWYLNKNRSKFTVDVLWALDPIPSTDGSWLTSPLYGTSYPALGLLGDSGDAENQTAIRGQYTVEY